MNTDQLARIDLNLLISLQVLLDEQNVSRAAERLHITQPAMSKTLSRLRDLFEDPLFTRSSHGVLPTPRALELAAGLQSVLGDISQLVSGPEFDPASFSGEIKLALSEYIAVVMLPELARRLSEQAPRLQLRVITRAENQLEQLSLGKLDLAIHIEQAEYGDDFRVEHLGSSPPAILTRIGHPLNKPGGKPISGDELGMYPIIRLYIADWEQAAMQRTPEVLSPLLQHQHGSLEISHLLTALEILRHTDYVMPAPAYILHSEEAIRGIAALPLPEERALNINYALVAHRRTTNSPLHNWLWEEITCTIRQLRTPLAHKIRQRVTALQTQSTEQ